jgi:hypothetical protein
MSFVAHAMNLKEEEEVEGKWRGARNSNGNKDLSFVFLLSLSCKWGKLGYFDVCFVYTWGISIPFQFPWKLQYYSIFIE